MVGYPSPFMKNDLKTMTSFHEKHIQTSESSNAKKNLRMKIIQRVTNILYLNSQIMIQSSLK